VPRGGRRLLGRRSSAGAPPASSKQCEDLTLVEPSVLTPHKLAGWAQRVPLKRRVGAHRGDHRGQEQHEVETQRFLATGGVASSFTTSEFHYVSGQAAHDGCNAIVVEPNGDIVVGGGHFRGTSVFGLERLPSTGTVDTTFGRGTGRSAQQRHRRGRLHGGQQHRRGWRGARSLHRLRGTLIARGALCAPWATCTEVHTARSSTTRRNSVCTVRQRRQRSSTPSRGGQA